jgi:hypothetical protein
MLTYMSVMRYNRPPYNDTSRVSLYQVSGLARRIKALWRDICVMFGLHRAPLHAKPAAGLQELTLIPAKRL